MTHEKLTKFEKKRIGGVLHAKVVCRRCREFFWTQAVTKALGRAKHVQRTRLAKYICNGCKR